MQFNEIRSDTAPELRAGGAGPPRGPRIIGRGLVCGIELVFESPAHSGDAGEARPIVVSRLPEGVRRPGTPHAQSPRRAQPKTGRPHFIAGVPAGPPEDHDRAQLQMHHLEDQQARDQGRLQRGPPKIGEWAGGSSMDRIIHRKGIQKTPGQVQGPQVLQQK